MNENEKNIYRQIYILSIFTIVYNLAEGLVSVILGYTDETLSLAGFGIDSFIEMVSGFGILMMVLRIRNNPDSPVSSFEVTALRITGYGFYVLSVGLVAGIIIALIERHKPVSTLCGTVVAIVSIGVMAWLYLSKRRLGKELDSQPVLSDARCTLVCIYMSVVLLAASGIYELTGFAYADVLGAAGLGWFSFTEGREAIEKAARKSYEE